MDQTQGSTNNSQSMIIVSAVIIIALLGLGLWQFNSRTQGTQQQNVMTKEISPTAMTAPETTTAMEQTGELKDGSYTATGNYTSPGGPEEIGVSLTIENGVVTEAEVEPMAERPMSQQFQGKFKAGFKELVIGKPVSEIALTVVNGSSLTPKGFMDAVQKIKTQAT